MYRWYSLSKICIAYLQDVAAGTSVKESEWFARGWTLQELIASKSVRFYDRTWNHLGDKSSLSSSIISRTGIPADVLKDSKPPQAYSVAQRMPWAARRTTIRLEDRAYSLMGLFDVNMPMIYGEREQAFIRLQEHIIAKSADESIFVWDLGVLEDSTREAKQVHCGLLAPTPACFAKCGEITNTGRSRGFRINQFGLVISSPSTLNTLGVYQAPLKVKNGKAAGNCAILLAKTPEAGTFARVSSTSGQSFVMTENRTDQPTEFSVPLEPTEGPLLLYHGFWLRKLKSYDSKVSDLKTFRGRDGGQDRLQLPSGETGTAGIIRLTLAAGNFGWVKLGFYHDSRPVCCLEVSHPESEKEEDRMAAQAKQLEEVQPRRPANLKLGMSTPERVNHPFFNDKWIRFPRRPRDLDPYHHDSRASTNTSGEGFTCKFEAPTFMLKVSVELIPDVSPSNSGRKQQFWAASIVVGSEPAQDTYRDDGCCC